LQKLFMKGQAFAQARHPAVRALIIGLLAMFLPCGWLYLFVIAAAATGSPLMGAAAMVAFWLGTVPILAAVGVGVQSLFGPLRKHLPAVMSCVLIVVGVFVSIRAGNIDTHNADALPTVETVSLGHIGEQSEKYVPPCCREGADADAATNAPADDEFTDDSANASTDAPPQETTDDDS
jgi:hypothetical protein